MAGFLDVLLRGLTLVSASIALGGMAWTLHVLRAEAHAKPDAAVARALRLTAVGAVTAAAAQVIGMVVTLQALAETTGGGSPLRLYLGTAIARTAVARVAIGAALGGLAMVMARRPAGRAAWAALAAFALALVGSSAAMSHAVARVEDRALLLAFDAAHQVGAAVWVGGLAHLTAFAALRRRETASALAVPRDDQALVRRFSQLALASVGVLVVAGLALTGFYVGDVGALLGTAYGVMIVSKVLLFAAALVLAWANFRAVRRARGDRFRLARFVEIELGLGVTVLFAAASLTSLPPAADVREDRATVAEVTARFAPAWPRLESPPIAALIREADPLMQPGGARKRVEREWSEYNHHWAGVFVVALGLLAMLERLGVRPARHWPLVFFGLAVFLFVRNDPRAWPLGPAGFWESFTLADVLQHRAFVLLVIGFGVFEWMVRTGRLAPRPWASVFPLLCAVGGGLLLTHSHAMFNVKEEFLVEVTHAPLGLLGAFAGWARWLEVRMPDGGAAPGWIWRGCLIGVGVLLLFYREG